MKRLQWFTLPAVVLVAACAATLVVQCATVSALKTGFAVLTDGGGLPPIKPVSTNPINPYATSINSDGGGLPPIKPYRAEVPDSKTLTSVADGGGLPPIKPARGTAPTQSQWG